MRIINIQWCSRNSKSHFARNLLANRRTNLTLIVHLGTKSDLLLEQLLIGEHYCTVKVTYYEPLKTKKSVHNIETSNYIKRTKPNTDPM